jgi:hypothetical protein
MPRDGTELGGSSAEMAEAEPPGLFRTTRIRTQAAAQVNSTQGQRRRSQNPTCGDDGCWTWCVFYCCDSERRGDVIDDGHRG